MVKFAIFSFIFISFYWITRYLDRNIKLIELHVLVDNDGRMSYTGSYSDCKNKLTKETKIVKLTGVLE